MTGIVIRHAGTVGIAASSDFEGSGTVDGTVISGNAVIGAGAGGLQVVSPGTTVKRNLLVRNASHDIEAVVGVTDGAATSPGRTAPSRGASERSAAERGRLI